MEKLGLKVLIVALCVVSEFPAPSSAQTGSFAEEWAIPASGDFSITQESNGEWTMEIPEGDYGPNSSKVLAFHLICDETLGCGENMPNPICYFTGDQSFPLDYMESIYHGGNKTYDLYLTKKIDREGDPRWLPKFINCGRSGAASQFGNAVVITDVNDNIPDLESRWEVTVEENLDYSESSGTHILDFTNQDNPPSDADGDTLFYFIMDELMTDQFMIGPNGTTGGKLFKKEPFDFERQTYFSIRMAVRDREAEPFNEVAIIVVITVQDQQDKAPQFQRTTSPITLRDEMKRGTILGEFKAVDGDVTPNIARNISYSMEKVSPAAVALLEIVTEDDADGSQGKIGVVRLKDDFDLEMQSSDFPPFLQLTIVALEVGAQEGEPNAQSTFPAFVSVSDVDDNNPEFVNPAFLSPFVVEHDSGYSQNFTVVDRDYDPKVYKLEISTDPPFVQEQGAFRITPTKGFKETPFLLTVGNADVLDYENEAARFINVTISVFPDGEPEKLSSWMIFMELEDSDDETPVFDPNQEDHQREIDEGSK